MDKYEKKIKKAIKGRRGDFDSWLKEQDGGLAAEAEQTDGETAVLSRRKIAVFILGGAAIILLAAILWIAIAVNGGKNYTSTDDSPSFNDNASGADSVPSETGEAMTEEEILSFAEEYAFLKKFDVNSAKTSYTENGIIYVFDLCLNAESGNYIVTAYFVDVGGAISDENFEDLPLSLTVGDYTVYYSVDGYATDGETSPDGGASANDGTTSTDGGTTSASDELYTYYIKSDLGEKTAYIKAETTCASAQTAIYEIFK